MTKHILTSCMLLASISLFGQGNKFFSFSASPYTYVLKKTEYNENEFKVTNKVKNAVLLQYCFGKHIYERNIYYKAGLYFWNLKYTSNYISQLSAEVMPLKVIEKHLCIPLSLGYENNVFFSEIGFTVLSELFNEQTDKSISENNSYPLFSRIGYNGFVQTGLKKDFYNNWQLRIGALANYTTTANSKLTGILFALHLEAIYAFGK